MEKGEKPGLDGNLIIEGDNLVALKALLPTHTGRIKCIYIDPPYNTGNEGWVYNDNLTQPQFKEWIDQTVGKEGEDATRHDKWCCMMYPRLQVLKELLHDAGAIFVSIDDIEIHHLRMMMDEIFGSDNRLGTLVWKSRNFPDTRPKTGVSVDHEYILAYRKSRDGRLLGKKRSEAKYSNPDNDPRGDWTSCSLLGKATKEQRPNLHYDIANPKTREVFRCPPETGWICAKATMERKIAESRILWPSRAAGRPREKVFLKELESGVLGFPSVIDGVFTSDGTEEIRQIFGGQNEKVLPFPKPSLLIRDLVAQVALENDFVLDSFAGSGTTAHAVLRLNKEDGGNRKCILVQIPHETKEQTEEKFNICESITLERVRRIIRGYTYTNSKSKKEKVAGLGGSFTYASVGKPLFGEYRDWGKELPTYEELAKYIFYTETSRDFDRKVINEKSSKIGEHHGTSYYLLYTSNGQEDRRLDMDWLKGLDKTEKNKNLVVYCEKIWVHRDDLAMFEQETKRTVRPMIVPFNLK
ncbi:MAG: site-specific DNA-methyltransferase [Candidatus Binatia bacterium]